MHLPIGVSDFRKLVEYKDPADKGYLFVDKSLFIREIIYDLTEVIVITRPRRFGKTLNLSMLQHFYASVVDGMPTAELFNGLEISKYPECMQVQGKHPVIFLTFKDVKADNFESAIKKLYEQISQLYEQHRYVIEANKISKEEKDTFVTILNKTADTDDLSFALQNLSYYIRKTLGQKVYILIDEYDTPIQNAYIKGYYEQFVSFIRGFLGAGLKGNPNMIQAILTGILRISKESLFSDLNNVKIHSIMSPKYSSYFGFTIDETNLLLTKAKLPTESKQTKEWYNGYNFGGTTIYNPWSIIEFIAGDGALEPYWVNTSGNDLIRELLLTTDSETQEKIGQLIAGKVITELVSEHMVFRDLKQDSAAIWSLFLMSGYLKVLSSSSTDFGKLCELAIPNKEVTFLYKQIFQQWISGSRGFVWYQKLLATLTEGKIDEFERKLQDIILQMASYHDTSENIQEMFYQGLMLGLLVGLTDTHEIRSNRESGLGRYDLLVIPKDNSKPGMVMEFKAIKNDDKDKLAQEAKKALCEIKTLKYTTELKALGISKIYEIGIAFSGKSLKMEYILS